MITAFLFLALAGNLKAETFIWYEVSQIRCVSEKGIELEYDQGVDIRHYRAKGLAAGETLYANGSKMVLERGYSEIEFTSHQPSAGPVINPYASDFAIRTKSPLEGKNQKIEGVLVESKAFGPWAFIDRVVCTLSSREIFPRR